MVFSFLQSFLGYKKQETIPLTKEQMAALALSAPYSSGFLDDFEGLAAPESANRLQKGLEEAWGVVDAETFDETAEWLIKEGHRYFYDLVAKRAIATGKNPTADNIYYDIDHFSTLDGGEKLEAYYRQLLMLQEKQILTLMQLSVPKSIMAWDMARLVRVTRNSVTMGFIEVESGWKICATALRLSRSQYTNWLEFANAFLVGRAFWFDFDDESLGESYGKMESYNTKCQTMLKDPASIWSNYPLHNK